MLIYTTSGCIYFSRCTQYNFFVNKNLSHHTLCVSFYSSLCLIALHHRICSSASIWTQKLIFWKKSLKFLDLLQQNAQDATYACCFNDKQKPCNEKMLGFITGFKGSQWINRIYQQPYHIVVPLIPLVVSWLLPVRSCKYKLNLCSLWAADPTTQNTAKYKGARSHLKLLWTLSVSSRCSCPNHNPYSLMTH